VDGAEEITNCIPRLRRYARALTGDRVLADDLVQDTLERAWGRRHMWRRGSDLRAWLFSIMHNLYVNQAVSRRGKASVALEDTGLDLPVPATQEERLVIRELVAALGRLTDEQREVLLLVGLEQMSYQEVAKVLGIPIGTVMSRLSRGRERLRALMSERTGPPQLKVVK
jgi:RNA polymerase sigma-70 factor (ECF subfamily)